MKTPLQERKDRWFANENNAARLQTLLADPVLAEAIGLVTAINSPAKGVTLMAETTAAASLYHYQSGIFDAFRGLSDLTRPEAPKSQPQPRRLHAENS